MKILTGSLRGRPLPFAPSPALRPTADRVRKAVFDVLQGYAEGRRVLDLYSGTGAMGFEALSQNADFVRFVERDAAQGARIQDTLKKWRLADRAEVDTEEVAQVLERLGRQEETYDLVFIDPPYKENLGLMTLRALVEARAVRAGGFVVVECGKREELPKSLGPLEVLRDRRYGQSRVVFYRARPS